MDPRSDAAAHRSAPTGRFDLLCIGLATVDTIVVVPSWPEPDGRTVVDGWQTAFGGGAATAAVTAARLGVRVAFAGVVGDDAEGRSATQALEAAGVDTTAVVVQRGPTARSVILVDRVADTRSILHAPGVAADARGTPGPTPSARWVHVDHAGYGSVAAVAAGRLSIDAGNPIPGLSLAGVGLYAPTRSALLARHRGRRLGEAMAAALAEGAERVAVTLGPDGALAADGTGAWRAPAVAVETVSTLGAGDVFHGALAAALTTGHALDEALVRANLAAALSCRALDGRGAIPTAAELAAAMQDSPRAEPISLEEHR